MVPAKDGSVGSEVQRGVKVEEGSDGLDPILEACVDQIIVVVDGLLIDGAALDAEGLDARPSDGEAIRLDPGSSQAGKVLLVQVVVQVGDVRSGKGWSIQFGEVELESEGTPALARAGAFNLRGGAIKAPDEVGGQLQPSQGWIAEQERNGLGLDQLRARNGSWRGGGGEGGRGD